MLFDSHCHLTDARFSGDVDAVLDRAAAAGVTGVVTIASDLDDARAARKLADRPGVWCTAGVHPHAAADGIDVVAIRDHAADPRCVAIGEMGLDYHYDTAPRATQRRVFDMQLDLAAAIDMPVVVHSRAADNDTIAAIRAAAPGIRGVLHCFTAGTALLEFALDVGWFVSFTGLVTFRNFDGESLVRRVPADRLMVETDSPYLAPVPHRGHRNEPAHVAHVCDALAAMRGVEPAALAQATTNTALAFYGLDPAERLGPAGH